MTKSLFLLLSDQIAQHSPLWTQGAGSNLSVKETKGKMLIKASGFRLDQVTNQTGFVELNSQKLNEFLLVNTNNPSSDQEAFYSESLMKVRLGQTDLRPSMEAGFHALSKFKYVLHFHSLAAILMAEFPDWLKQKNINLIPLANPGWELSKFFISNISELNVLMNHGIILQSDSESILEHWSKIEDEFLNEFKLSKIKFLKDKVISTNQALKTADLISYSTGPLKFYFPDMAIYWLKLKPFLIPIENGNFQLSSQASKDLFEIWTATQILYQSYPQLPDLPEKMIEEITKLPTEKLRQTFIKG